MVEVEAEEIGKVPGGVTHKCAIPTRVHAPTVFIKKDPKLRILSHFVKFAPLNCATPAKHNPKWRIFIVIALKMIP